MPLRDYQDDFSSYGSRPEFDFFGAGRGLALSPAASPSGPAPTPAPAGSEFLASAPPVVSSPVPGSGDVGPGDVGPGAAPPGENSSTGSFGVDPADIGGTVGGLALGPIGGPIGRGIGNAVAFANAPFANSQVSNYSVPSAIVNSVAPFGFIGQSIVDQTNEMNNEITENELTETVSLGGTAGAAGAGPSGPGGMGDSAEGASGVAGTGVGPGDDTADDESMGVGIGDTGADGDGGGGDCHVTTALVDTETWGVGQKMGAVRWCMANKHGHYWGETWRDGYHVWGKGVSEIVRRLPVLRRFVRYSTEAFLRHEDGFHPWGLVVKWAFVSPLSYGIGLLRKRK